MCFCSGACCDNGRYFLLHSPRYCWGETLTLFEGPVAFIFLHHLLMSYLTTLSRVKIVLSLTMHWGANRKFRHPGPVGPGTCCAGRNCSGFVPLCDNSTPGRQECQDFLPRFIQKSFPGARLSIRICFAPVTMFCLWKRPPGPPGLMMRVIYHFVVPSGGRAPPGSICVPLPSLRSMPVVPTLPAMVSSLILEPLFSWL